VEVELILSKSGKLSSQFQISNLEKEGLLLDMLCFSGGRNWNAFSEDVLSSSSLNHSYCWRKGHVGNHWYYVEFKHLEDEFISFKFKELVKHKESGLIDSLAIELLNSLPFESAIVNIAGEVIESNSLFNGNTWNECLSDSCNLDLWSQACVDVFCLKSSQSFLCSDKRTCLRIKLLPAEKSKTSLFLIQVSQDENSELSSEFIHNRKPLNSFNDNLLSLSYQNESKSNLIKRTQFYETVLHSIPVDIAVFDKNQRYAFVNKYGISDSVMREWIIGKTDFDYCEKRGVNTQMAKERKLIFNQAIQKKKPQEIITEHHKNDIPKYVLRRFQPYFEGNEVTHVIGYGVEITNQIIYENKLKESEQFGRRLLDGIETNILVLNDNLSFVYLNSYAKNLLEIDTENLEGFDFQMFLKELDRAKLISCINSFKQAVIQKDKLRVSILPLKSNTLKEVEIHFHPFEFEHKPCFFLTINDITEFIDEVEKREEAEELARVIINTALDAVITANEDGEIVAWSRKAVEMFGYEEHEVLGRKISDVVIPNELKAHHDAGMERMKSSTKSNGTGRLIRLKSVNKKGDEFPIEIFINQIKVKDKKLFSAFIRDVSEQVRAEQSIIESERQLTFLLGSIPSVPYSASLTNDFEFIYLHSRILGLTGFHPNDFIDCRVSWINRIHPKDLNYVLTALRMFAENGEGVVEYRFLHAEEKYIWIRNSVSINKNEDSLPDSVSGVFEDITEKRIRDAIDSEIQRIEVEILQLDWKAFKDVNVFCSSVIKKINRTLSFLHAEIWDFKADENLFYCIASSKGKREERTDFMPSEAFLSKLQQETFFFLDSSEDNSGLCNSEFGDCLISGIKRDGLVKGFLIFSSREKKTKWSSQVKTFIKSTADRLSLVAESFLRRSAQDKLSKAFQNGHMTVFEWRNDTDLIEWADDSYRIDFLEALPKNLTDLFELVYMEDKGLLMNTFGKARQSNENYSCTFRLFDKEGKMRFFDLNLTREGSQNRVLGFLMDVSSKTKAEKELQRLNDGANQLNSVIASLQMLSDESLIRKQFASSIINSLSIADCFFMTKAGGSFSLLEESENTNKHNVKLQSQLIQLKQKVFSTCWKSGSPLMQQIKLPILGEKPLQFIVIPFAVSDNIESLIVAYCSDVEEQSDARADFMMKCVEVLKQRLLKLRNELALKKLNNELLISNHQLEQYSYIIAHNLRAPFSNLKGITSLINHERISDKEDQMLFLKLIDTINGIDQILVDLNKLLTIQNALDVKYERIQIDKLFTETLKTMEQDFHSVNAIIEVDTHQKNEILACQPYILSVFHNLLSNSYKYRNPETILEILVKSWEDESGNTIILFKDNGVGIDLNRYKDRIFKLYSRFHRHVSGSGLGLYLVKSQINSMGGEIDIESAPGKGTSFYIKFKNQLNENLVN
jgi:PAS domain S-box-containing protein